MCICVCVWGGVGVVLSWLQASSVPRLWFLHHLSPLQGSERPPPPSHLPDPTKALVSLLIMKEKVRRIRVIPPPGERLTSEPGESGLVSRGSQGHRSPVKSRRVYLGAHCVA